MNLSPPPSRMTNEKVAYLLSDFDIRPIIKSDDIRISAFSADIEIEIVIEFRWGV